MFYANFNHRNCLGVENMHADITVYRLGVTLRLHVNKTKVMSLDETKC